MTAPHCFLIAAPQSGSGKTTVSLAIMSALVRRGMTVAPFKCGPDFIDPGYHRAVTGAPSLNLDGWMCSDDYVRQTLLTGRAGQSIAVIEGAMGLFDGLGASSRVGSSAQIAAITGAPVVLVVSARGMAASAAALVSGFACFDPQVRLGGVIFNNVGTSRHAELLREALALHCPDIPCFGCIPRDETLAIPSRHLGLITAEDNPLSPEFIDRLADMAERHLDLDRLCGLVTAAVPAVKSSPCTIMQQPETAPVSPVRIAVARDAAFCFCYEDNLRLLREAGAELAFFSPLSDSSLPDGIHGIYLPGGYPELYARQLAANVGMKDAVRSAVTGDLPVYAECGGFIYLTEGLDATENQEAADFAGIFPTRCRMLPRRKALGYREVELMSDCCIGTKGEVLRGHEFHYSEISAMPDDVERCYRVSRDGVALGTEGYRQRNCLASYVHIHFGSNPGIAAAFVAACRG